MDKKKLRYKWICYFLLAFSVILLQTTVLENVNIFGGTPSLMPFIVCTIAMLEGVNGGAAAGLAIGLFSDALLSPSEGFYMILYVLCAIAISFLRVYIFRKNYFIALLYTIITMVIINFFYCLIFMLILGRGGILPFILMLPGELSATLIFTPFVYFVLIGIYKRFYTLDDSLL